MGAVRPEGEADPTPVALADAPAGGFEPVRPGTRIVGAVRRNPGLLAALAAASGVRLWIDRNAPPGVYQDSLVYLRASPHAPFAPYSPARPSGYPLILRVLGVLPGAQLNTVTLAQHVAGVLVGILVYLLVLRSGGRRWLALTAAAVVLADSYTVAVEQAVLAETMFTLSLAASAYLTLRRSDRPWSPVAGGVLLGIACTIRSVGVFAVPVWALWLVLARPGRKVVAAGLFGVALPVLGYCAVHAAGGAGFSLQESDGWYLYAKIGRIADCRGASVPAGAEALCERPGPSPKPFEYFLYDGGSPAYTLFYGKGVDLEEAVTRENNRLLRKFSLSIIEAHPGAFVNLVSREFIRYLGPTEAQGELTLYGRPGTILHGYERWVHLRWWMFSGALAVGVAWALAGNRTREIGLLVGMSVALVLGAAATSGFNNRYLLPTLPLVAAAGALAFERALGGLEGRLARPPGGRRRRTVRSARPPDPG